MSCSYTNEIFCRKYNGSRLTEHRNAVIVIKNIRPVFTRIPPGNNVRSLSRDSHLIFEVGYVDILGSDDENQFGNPKDVEEDEKVMMWTKGLREHGGGGYVVSPTSLAPNGSDLTFKQRLETDEGSGRPFRPS